MVGVVELALLGVCSGAAMIAAIATAVYLARRNQKAS